jgi:hypothetical protein
VNLGIKAFEDSSFHSFEVFSKPVDLEHSRDRIHESFIAFEDFERVARPPSRR